MFNIFIYLKTPNELYMAEMSVNNYLSFSVYKWIYLNI